jgi:hypothetical protein
MSETSLVPKSSRCEIIDYVQEGYVDISALEAKLSEQKRLFRQG